MNNPQISYFSVLLTYHRLTITKSSRIKALEYLMDTSASPSLEVPDPTPCGECGNDIHRPSALFEVFDCRVCTNHTVFCVCCNGTCRSPQIRQDGTYADCNACASTGLMILCDQCDSDGHIGERRDGRRILCQTCHGKGAIRCPRCDATREVWVFRRFCLGEDGDDGSSRRHPNARDIPRHIWSRVNLDERNTS